jgi:RNA polymerase sigma-70 factor (ECF subfamily)
MVDPDESPGMPLEASGEGGLPGGEDRARSEHFVRLFAQNHQRLLAYILAFVHDRTSAEEVFQETSLILWREFPNFRREAPFMPWACGIAFNQLRKFWRQRKHEKLTFSLPLLEELAKESVEMEEELESRRAALGECLKRLPDEDRQLVQQYYSIKTTAQELAEKLGKSVHTIYKALNRTRRRLFDCIARRLAAEQR